MRKISLALAFIASLLAVPAQAANFSAKDAAAATIVFVNPQNCTTGCVPIFSWYDSTGANAVAVVTAGADAQSNTANGGLTYGRNLVFNGTTWDRWLGDATNGGFVNVKTSVLPTGAATSAAQTAAQTSLSSIDTKTPALGQALAAASVPVILPAATVTTLTPPTTVTVIQPTGTNLHTVVDNTNANGQALAANSSPVVLPVAQVTADPCSLGAKTNLPISQNGTASVQLVALSGATSIYVCSLSLIAAGATTVALTTGTGSACVTGNAAVIGTTTASIANSMSLAANGGLTLGNGAGTIAKGAASSELCMVLGTSVFVSGNLTYVQQ